MSSSLLSILIFLLCYSEKNRCNKEEILILVYRETVWWNASRFIVQKKKNHESLFCARRSHPNESNDKYVTYLRFQSFRLHKDGTKATAPEKKPFLQNYVSAAHNYFSPSRDITGNNIISAFIQQCVIILMDRLDLVIRRFGRSHPRRRLRTVSRPSRWSQRENCPIKPPRSVSLTSPPPHRLPNRLLLFTSANRMRIFAGRISGVIYFIYTDLISGPIQLC